VVINNSSDNPFSCRHSAPLHENWGLMLLALICIILSHVIVDVFSLMTYHVPDPRPYDKFWLSYHIVMYILTAIFTLFLVKEFWIPMVASCLIDIADWLFIRPIFKKQKGIIHPYIVAFRNLEFPWIPNFIEKKWSVLIEFGLIFGLSMWIHFL
jgi:hypothetical protein